jgi:hypothetical protein
MFQNKYIMQFITIIGFVIAVWSIFSHEERELSYNIVSTIDTSSLKSVHLPTVQLSYDGENIERGGIITFRVTNTGDIPIYSKEFDGPIKIYLDPESLFIGATVVNTTPVHLKASVSLNEGSIEIAPLLLNSGDKITIQAIAQGNLNKVNVLGRIGGIDKIEDLSEDQQDRRLMLSWLLVLFGLMGFISYSLVWPIATNKNLSLVNRTISQREAILIVLVVITSATYSLSSFASMHEIEYNLKSFIYLVILIIISETIATFFRVKKSKNYSQK